MKYVVDSELPWVERTIATRTLAIPGRPRHELIVNGGPGKTATMTLPSALLELEWGARGTIIGLNDPALGMSGGAALAGYVPIPQGAADVHIAIPQPPHALSPTDESRHHVEPTMSWEADPSVCVVDLSVQLGQERYVIITDRRSLPAGWREENGIVADVPNSFSDDYGWQVSCFRRSRPWSRSSSIAPRSELRGSGTTAL